MSESATGFGGLGIAERVRARLGGHTRAKVIGLLAAVFALESADMGAIGTAATSIEHAFGIGHAQLGLLVTVSLSVGAVATIPFGVLADRANRVRLLAVAIVLWSIAMVASGAAPSYGWLLAARVGLGVVAAVGVPVTASLIGDLFEPEERSRIYSFILTGDFVGTAIGVVLSGNAAALSWRYAFWVLALPGVALAWAVGHHLPEPERGGASRLADHHRDREPSGAQRTAREQGVPPVPERVLEPDERGLSLRSAVTYVLRIPTNRRLIVASSLGYFYLTGVRTFAVPFLRGRFGIGQSLASTLLLCLGIGAVAGVLVAGRLADGLLERGHLDSRIALPASAYLLGAVVLLPGLLVGSLPMAMLLYVLGAALLTAANPPLDAARLDVIPSALWGRAESVRTVVHQTCQASAPLLFGVVAEGLGGPGTEKIAGPGLRYALLILLSALVLSSVVVWSARRAYPRDVATAAVSGRRPGRSDKP